MRADCTVKFERQTEAVECREEEEDELRNKDFD